MLCSTQFLIALPLHSCRLWIFFMMVFEVRAADEYMLNSNSYVESVLFVHVGFQLVYFSYKWSKAKSSFV